MALSPKAFVDGVMNGFSLHIEPPSYLSVYTFLDTLQTSDYDVFFFCVD